MNARKYILILLGFLTFTYVNGSTISSSSTELISTASSTSTDTIVLIVTLVSGLLTILTVAVQSLRSDKDTKSDTPLNEKLNQLNKDTLEDKIKTIQQTLNSLDVDVHQHIEKKIQSLDNNYTALDKQLAMFTKYLETSIDDRKEESKQLKQELNTIRDNIREDLNDVRKLINEITLAMKLDD